MSGGNAQNLYLDVFFSFEEFTHQVSITTKQDFMAFVGKVRQNGIVVTHEGRRTWIPPHRINAVQIGSKERDA